MEKLVGFDVVSADVFDYPLATVRADAEPLDPPYFMIHVGVNPGHRHRPGDKTTVALHCFKGPVDEIKKAVCALIDKLNLESNPLVRVPLVVPGG